MSSAIEYLGSALTALWNGMPMQAIISVGSAAFTAYCWLVKMNKDRAGVRLYRVADFRPDRLQCSDVAGKARAVWYSEVCVANPSSLPAALVGVQVQLWWHDSWLDGKLVLEKKDDVPWVVEPLRVLSRGFGCAFNVPENTARDVLTRPQRIRFTFTTVEGKIQRQEITTCNAQPQALAA